jgi:hypothetical protein
MDLYDEAYLNLWRVLYEHQVRYILIGVLLLTFTVTSAIPGI